MSEFENGVWRTIKGRHVFIRNGKELSDAISESGKWRKPVTTKQKKTYTNVRQGLKKVEGKPDGTYNIETGEPMIFEGGFMCSFFQEMDEYSDKKLDQLCTEWANKTDGNIYAGVFGSAPEISFFFESLDECISMMKQYNQKGIWDNELGNIGNSIEDWNMGYVENPWFAENKRNGSKK